ncbi:MAG: hypothetical protein WBM74_00665 [Polyangiales bacterium]
MRWFVYVCVLVALGSCKDEIYFIPGTGTLPDCNEAPVVNLNGMVWFNTGPVTVLTAGCPGVEADDVRESCPENWAITQSGNDLDIIVDEYRVKGRLCGDKLHLEGGWWLSVQNEGACWYGDDDGDDFRIEAEGNVVTFVLANPNTAGLDSFEGTLVMLGRCKVSYDVTLMEAYSPSF